jgi:hypothetical protein
MTGSSKAVDQEEGPDEVELLLDADGPEVFERPHQVGAPNVVKEKEGADKIDTGENEPSGQAQQDNDSYIEIERRQDAKGAAEVKAAKADGATFFMLLQEQTGDEEATDLKEDEDSGLSIEDGVPNP